MRLQDAHIRTLIAPLYKDACLDPNIDMISFSNLMEYLRKHLKEKNPHTAWRDLSINKEKYNSSTYLNYLVKLEENYFQLLADETIKKIQDFSSNNLHESTYNLWYKEFAQAFVAWDSYIYVRLLNIPLEFTKQQKVFIKKLKKVHSYLLNADWAPVKEMFLEFANNNNLELETRANFYIYIGQIELYHTLPSFEKAEEYFYKSKELLDGDDVNRALGEYHLMNRKYNVAKDFFLKAIDMDLSDLDNYLFMGDCYREEGNFETAYQWYEDASNINCYSSNSYRRKIVLLGYSSKIDPNKDETQKLIAKLETLNFEHSESNLLYNNYMDIAYAYKINSNWDIAEFFYKKAIDLKPKLVPAYHGLGYIYIEKKEYLLAESHFITAKELEPTIFNTYWGLSYLYEFMEQWQKSIDNLLVCLELRPTQTAYTLSLIGNCYQKMEDFDQAITYHNLSLQQDANQLNTVIQITDILKKLKGEKAAESFLIKHIENVPNNPLFENELAVFQYNHGKYGEAIIHYLKAIKLNPEEPLYWENLGLAYEKKYDIDSAENTYLKAIEYARDDDGKYHNRMGYFLGTIQKHEEALDYYKEAHKREPENILYSTNLAIGYNKVRQWEKSIEVSSEILEKDPENVIVLSEISVAYIWLGQLAKAKPFIEKAIILDNKNPAHYETLGHIYFSEKKYEDAVRTFEKGLVLAPNHDSIHNRLGVVRYCQNRMEDAIEHHFKAIAINPTEQKYKDDLNLAQNNLEQM